MHAVGSEIWRCSGILCEGEPFVRGWTSCLRTALRREINVLPKLVYKGACVFFVLFIRNKNDRYEGGGTTPTCAINLQGVPSCPRGVMKGRHGGVTGMYHQHASQSSAGFTQRRLTVKEPRYYRHVVCSVCELNCANCQRSAA